jgi:hypothetical protein
MTQTILIALGALVTSVLAGALVAPRQPAGCQVRR